MKRLLLKLAGWVLTRYKVTVCVDTKTGVSVDIDKNDIVRIEDDEK